MLQTYIETCETIGGIVAIFSFYYTIYECYKIGYSLNYKKNLAVTVKENKSGLASITFLVLGFLIWGFSIFMLEQSFNSTPTPPIKSPSQWTQPHDKDLEKVSKIMASIHFQYLGKSSLVYNFDQDTWAPFAPNNDDIRKHDEYVILKEKINNQMNQAIVLFLFVGSIWFTVGLIGWNASKNNNG